VTPLEQFKRETRESLNAQRFALGLSGKGYRRLDPANPRDAKRIAELRSLVRGGVGTPYSRRETR
jgi:hypothetical protein